MKKFLTKFWLSVKGVDVCCVIDAAYIYYRKSISGEYCLRVSDYGDEDFNLLPGHSYSTKAEAKEAGEEFLRKEGMYGPGQIV